MQTYVSAVNQHTLCAVYRFFDAFLAPFNSSTPPIAVPLKVSVPSFGWDALRVESDSTYRFGAGTLTQAAPSGPNLPVSVLADGGDYVSHVPILLTLPLAVSTPPLASDFRLDVPLWPTTRLRPPAGETAIHGHIVSPTLQPVDGLRVEMWTGAAPVPPPGTPFTLSDANGDFLFRFALLKAPIGQSLAVRIRLQSGLLPVIPASLPVSTGRTQIIPFQRT